MLLLVIMTFLVQSIGAEGFLAGTKVKTLHG